MPTTPRRYFFAPALALAAALLSSFAVPAVAATPPDEAEPTTWQVQPTGPDGPGQRAYFVLEADPGTTVHDMVAITNLSQRDVTMRVFASDAFNAVSGEFDLLATAENPVDVGAWTTIDPASVAADGTITVPARSRLSLPFSIEIPANATPGDHVGGIVTSVPTVRTAENGEQVLVDARVAARVYLAVPGDLVPRLQVGDVRAERTGEWWNPFAGEVEVTWTVTNTGNVRLAGSQEVSVAGPFGLARVAITADALSEVLPGNSVEQTVTLSGVPAAGLLTIDGTLQPVDTTGRVANAINPVPFGGTLTAVPWAALGVLLVLALITWLIVRSVRRRRAAIRALHAEVAALKESADGGAAAAADAGADADAAADDDGAAPDSPDADDAEPPGTASASS